MHHLHMVPTAVAGGEAQPGSSAALPEPWATGESPTSETELGYCPGCLKPFVCLGLPGSVQPVLRRWQVGCVGVEEPPPGMRWAFLESPVQPGLEP